MSDWREDLKTREEKIQYVHHKNMFTDVSICVTNKGKTEVFPAHQFILILASKYFENKLKGKRGKTIEIDLSNMDFEAFRIFLKYIYYDEINLKSVKEAIDLYAVAYYLSVNDLRDLCLEYIENNLGEATYCMVLKFAEEHKIDDIIEICKKKIQTHTKRILCKANYPYLDNDAILLILNQKMLNIIEYDLFKQVVAWMEYKNEEEGISVDEVKSVFLKKICFLNMSAQQFAEGPGKSDLLTKKQYRAIYSNLSKAEDSKPYPDGFNKNIRDLYQMLSFETSQFIFKTEAVKVSSIFFTVDNDIFISKIRVLTHVGNNNEIYREKAAVKIMECSSEQIWDWKNVAHQTYVKDVPFSHSFSINFNGQARILKGKRHSLTLEFTENRHCGCVDLNNVTVKSNGVEFVFSKYQKQSSKFPISSISFDL